MLFKQVHLEGIKSGKIKLAFRNWQKASVKAGTLLHTSIGLVEIHHVEVVRQSDITDEDACNAGFADKKQLLKSLTYREPEKIFKISLSYHSADPRIKLREQTELSEQQFEDLKNKLQRLDNYSRQGHWTEKILAAINDNPNLHAIGIAKLTGLEKEWLKLNIRKLKNLGLTISHTVGYEISPLGEKFLARLTKGDLQK